MAPETRLDEVSTPFSQWGLKTERRPGSGGVCAPVTVLRAALMPLLPRTDQIMKVSVSPPPSLVLSRCQRCMLGNSGSLKRPKPV